MEIDFVLHLHDGRYALIEVKLGSHEIEKAAKNMLKLRDVIRKHNETAEFKTREPDLMIVLTGGIYAYTRDDGVKVIPIGTLRD